MQLGKRQLRALVPILVLFGLSACSKDEDDDALPLGDATAMRGLAFKTTPRSKHIDRNEYLEDARNQYANADDAWVKDTFDHFGRLGFFSKPDDIRSSGGTSEALTAAFYSPATKAITILGKPAKEIVVHELVHALQDQHFDLVALENTPMTTDEDAALQATIEGDATLSQYRFHFDEQHADALATARASLTADRVLQASESTLAEAKEQPLYFYGHWGLNYSYGLGYVAARAGIMDGNWSTSAIDPLFGDQKPHTTREILNRSAPEPVPSVGLGELPTSVAADLDVVLVDRLGQWHTYLLLVPSAPSHEAMQTTTQGWSARACFGRASGAPKTRHRASSPRWRRCIGSPVPGRTSRPAETVSRSRSSGAARAWSSRGISRQRPLKPSSTPPLAKPPRSRRPASSAASSGGITPARSRPLISDRQAS